MSYDSWRGELPLLASPGEKRYLHCVIYASVLYPAEHTRIFQGYTSSRFDNECLCIWPGSDVTSS